MPERSTPQSDPTPARQATESPGRDRRHRDPVEIVCDRCGATNLIRVKGCWYCERCHYKFDCYGW